MYFHWSISRRLREIQNVSNRFSQFGKSRHVDGRQESFLVAWALLGILLENIQWNNWGLACECLFGAFCKFSYFVKLLFILALLNIKLIWICHTQFGEIGRLDNFEDVCYCIDAWLIFDNWYGFHMFWLQEMGGEARNGKERRGAKMREKEGQSQFV